MATFELRPVDGRKSFHGKALVNDYGNGEAVLYSYNTPVCKRTKSGKFIRLWDGCSNTTMCHVNAFLSAYNMQGGGKAWWTSQDVAAK